MSEHRSAHGARTAAHRPMLSERPAAVVVLAAGEGTRMRSAALPKVLHGFAGRSLLGHVLAATAALDPVDTLVVVGHRRDEVVAHLAGSGPPVTVIVQDKQRGTGHAVRLAVESIPTPGGTVVVLPADTPLLQPNTLLALLGQHTSSGAAATLLTSVVDHPTGYGRVIRDGDAVRQVVEQKDANPAELAITEIAAGAYAFDLALLRGALDRLSTDNAQGEEYLPDVVAILAADGHVVGAVSAPAAETAGVNDRVQLAAAHRAYNTRLLEAHMRAGVTVVDPLTTWVDADVQLAPDVTLLPSVDLHGSTVVGSGATIGPQTTLVDTTVGERTVIERAVCRGARIGTDATIGPFAYLRPGAALADGVHVGAYVEIKASEIGAGAKVPHLTYVGDASIGEHSNIGAATVFVNYDGVAKHRSSVGSHVSIGADNMLVAPVHVGDGAYTAAGTVVTEDVPPGALAIGRARQRNVPGWVLKRRPGSAAATVAERAEEQAAESTPPSGNEDPA
ncbi:MAG: bifunctional UDP-N-acetylglucosamine diphosphorylase/glucosamine-1-phosphate N-acetyltransferase GlmU [Actinomycetota bacterium]